MDMGGNQRDGLMLMLTLTMMPMTPLEVGCDKNKNNGDRDDMKDKQGRRFRTRRNRDGKEGRKSLEIRRDGNQIG